MPFLTRHILLPPNVSIGIHKDSKEFKFYVCFVVSLGMIVLLKEFYNAFQERSIVPTAAVSRNKFKEQRTTGNDKMK